MQGPIRVRHEHFPIVFTDVDSRDAGVEAIQPELLEAWNLEHNTHEPTVKPAVTDNGDMICTTVTLQQFRPNLSRPSHRLIGGFSRFGLPLTVFGLPLTVLGPGFWQAHCWKTILKIRPITTRQTDVFTGLIALRKTTLLEPIRPDVQLEVQGV